MKIVDKTPLIDDKGNLGFTERLQGMLKYGFNWPNELQAQNAIVKFFESRLEKGYTLIRNLTLGESGIMIPIILVGPVGIYVIEVTSLRGRYEAKGDSWNIESGNQYKPAPVNMVQRTLRMARALQAYIERQGVKLAVPIEAVLIAGDPGLHIESVRPAIKVMMIDGIKPFVNGLVTGTPILRADLALDYTDRIVHPRAKIAPIVPDPEPEPRAAWEQDLYEEAVPEPIQPQPSRARAIFNASAESQPLNSNDFDFALAEDDESAQTVSPVQRAVNPAKPVRQSNPKQQQRMLGMTPMQVAIIAILGLAFVCMLVALVYVFMFMKF